MSAPDTKRKRGGLSQYFGWALLAIFAILIWPTSLGGATTIIIVSGSSMEPTYFENDVVVLRKAAQYDVGDVIAYKPFHGIKASVIHRIAAIDEAGEMTLRGDNNTFDDPFYPDYEDIQGRALFSIPKIGLLFSFVSQPIVWVSLLLIAFGIYFSIRNDEPASPEPQS
ncbi:MAG TPA: signal peptidase I [Actinomycetales bacterium]|nr:signal peptidase I [Actinomycetales bacterium]